MLHPHYLFGLLCVQISPACIAQKNSAAEHLKQLTGRYFSGLDKKINIYSNRITTKTVRTLTKLSNRKNKILKILLKADPSVAERIFGNNQLVFATLLQQVKQGETIALQVQALYDKYRDDITTNLNYVAQQNELFDSNLIKKTVVSSSKMNALNAEENNSEAAQQLIKTRKKQLIQAVLKQAGSSKYLAKINKESYYYTETLKNYKELFTYSKKAEETAKEILSKIPTFQRFIQQNSLLAAMFGQGGGAASSANGASLAGLQNRASVQSFIQSRIAAGGSNATEAFHQNMEQTQAALSTLKEKLANALTGAGSGEGNMQDYVPTDMKQTETFDQCIEYSSNIQFSRINRLMPGTSGISLNLGYRLNAKVAVGIAGSYKLGSKPTPQSHACKRASNAVTFNDLAEVTFFQH